MRQMSNPSKTLKSLIRETIILIESEISSGTILYTGIVFDDDEILKLRKRAQALFSKYGAEEWIFKKLGVHGVESLNHHVTITLGSKKLPEDQASKLGKPIRCKVVGWGIDEKTGVAAWKIELPNGFETKSGNPHSTAALSDENVKPFLAGKISDWKPIDVPFIVNGTLQEVRAL